VKSATSHPEKVIAREHTSESVCYEIIDILGEGGSGVTYRAKNSQTQALVALKALSLHRIDDWKSIELFEREAQILSKLDRSGIPQYLDYFTLDADGDRYFYIVQALAPGKTLSEWMASGWRATEAEAKHIAIEILKLLIYLHRHTPPIIHRDIKPSNILRTAEGVISLVDFGAVQQTYHDTFMRGSTVVGTYGYMAPEQFRGQAVPATDLYGLGATILHLLTHRSPAEIPQDGLRLNFRDRLQVSSGFADWLERMLEPDANQRFSSAVKALSLLKSPPKVFKPTLSKTEFILAGALGLGLLAAIFGIFDRYKYHFFDMAGLVSKEPIEAMDKKPTVEQMRGYLGRGFNVNNKNQQGEPLLTMAIDRDLPDIVKLLVERGANLKNEDNEVEELRERRKSLVAVSNEISKSSFILMGERERARKIKQEEELRQSLKETGFNGVAYYAIKKNRVDILQAALDRGIKVDGVYPNSDKLSLLHLASVHQDGAIVKLLLDRGANPNAQDWLGCSPLHTAILREMMPYQSDVVSRISLKDGNKIVFKDSIIHLVKSGAKIDSKCRIITARKPGHTSGSYKQDTIENLTASKLKIDRDKVNTNTDDRTDPLNLVFILGIEDIDLKSYLPSK
jgi:ankyrin repeat protein